tara:strand:+ start:1503 stop:1787 length:285 start_codon:yes stop_codon:yes gene_type:complete
VVPEGSIGFGASSDDFGEVTGPAVAPEEDGYVRFPVGNPADPAVVPLPDGKPEAESSFLGLGMPAGPVVIPEFEVGPGVLETFNPVGSGRGDGW